MKYLILCLKGMVVGAANIIPGVSGGTLAVVLGIFDRLIESVNHFTKDVKKSLQFLLPLGVGMAVGIIGLGSLIDYGMRHFSFPTATFFVGLVVGSLPLIYKTAASRKSSPVYYGVAVAAAMVVIAMALLKPSEATEAARDITPGFMALLFMGGVVAAAAMVVPGISGSFMMVLMGLYPTVLHTVALVKDYLLNPTQLSLLPPLIQVCAPLGLGIVLGVVLVSKAIAFLLEKHFSLTYFAILGLMIGTIFALFNDPITYQSHPALTFPLVAAAVVTFAAGAAAALVLGKE